MTVIGIGHHSGRSAHARRWRAAVTVTAAAVLAAGCGSSAGGSPAARSPNVLACQHFKVQGERFHALAAPTLADEAQAVAWVEEDAALATDRALHRDLGRWVTDFDALLRGHPPAGNPKTAIVADCARLGVPRA
jgi:hypothetical protein